MTQLISYLPTAAMPSLEEDSPSVNKNNKNQLEKNKEEHKEDLAVVAAKFLNQILHGKYSAAFSHIVVYLNTLTPERLRTEEIQAWTSDLLHQALEETQGFQKIVKEDKFSSFIYYLNMVLTKIEKDYVWLKNCLPLGTIDYIFSNLIQHNELNMARSFLPVITDKNIENYGYTLDHCFHNKSLVSFDFLTDNLNGINHSSVDLLLDVYTNFGSDKAYEFLNKYHIDPCAFSQKNQHSSLLTKVFEAKDKVFLTRLLQDNPQLFEGALTQYNTHGHNNLSYLTENDILALKDVLFSVDLPAKFLLSLYNISFEPTFITKAAGTDYYKKLFSQASFDAKEASRGQLEIYYDLCDMSYAELAKSTPTQSAEQARDMLLRLNETVSIIEDFLTHYQKPLTPMQNLNELTYVLNLQKQMPFTVHSTLIDKIIKLRPELVEGGQEFVEKVYAGTALVRKANSFQDDQSGVYNQRSNSVPIWSPEFESFYQSIASLAKSFVRSPFHFWRYYKNIKAERTQKRTQLNETVLSSAQNFAYLNPAQFQIEIEPVIAQLETQLETLSVSAENKEKCGELLTLFKEIKSLIISTGHSLTIDESYMLRQSVPQFIASTFSLYTRLQLVDNSAVLEKLELQYSLLKTQLTLLKNTLTQDISEKIEKEISTHNIVLNNKNVKYQSLSASK